MPNNSIRLLKLAEAEFPDLTEPEREVVRCAAEGVEADLSQWSPHSAVGDERKTGGGPLRSAVVTWLCTDACAKRKVHRKGILISFATLDMVLDLESADVPFFFGLHGCIIPCINARNSIFKNNLYIKFCVVKKKIVLALAQIHGQLLLGGSSVLGDQGSSIEAFGIVCKDLFLNLVQLDNDKRYKFSARGEVNLTNAIIKGTLDCSGGEFLYDNGPALRIENATIHSSLDLSSGFLACGDVFLSGATIYGQCDCSNGKFQKSKSNVVTTNNTNVQRQCALSADNTKIHNNLYLSGEFVAKGEVWLPGVKIGGQMSCVGGSFENSVGNAIVLQGATIKSALFFDPKLILGKINIEGAEIEGPISLHTSAMASVYFSLRNTKVRVLYDKQSSWPSAGKLILDGFEYDEIHHSSPRSVIARLDWLGRMPNGQFLPQPYEQLAKWFQKTGHDSEARAVRIAKEEQRRKHFTRWQEKLWWWLKFWTIGYGYKPHYALYSLGGLILIGWLIFAFGHKGMTQTVSYNLKATDTQNTTATLIASDYPQFQPFVYSVDVALPIVDLQQERYWMPNSHHKGNGIPWYESGWWLWGTNWAEVLLGWFLASMGIAGATGIIRKD